MKQITFFFVVTALLVTGGLVMRQQRALASNCNTAFSACGYFNDVSWEVATDNVLPWPALYYDNTPGELINTITADLNGGNGYHAQVGAAFIVDDMLQYNNVTTQPAGGGVGAGISYAQKHFTQWVNLVNFYGSSPNQSIGINFNYLPSTGTFCDGGNNIGSGYDPGQNDPVFYKVPKSGTKGCNFEYTNSMPEIQFYWQGKTFDIGKLCGNIQQSAQIFKNNPPYGTISLTCSDANIGEQTAKVTLGDLDGPTDGYITVNGWTSGKVSSPGPTNIILPLPSTVTPFNAQSVTLWVKDVGAFGDNQYHNVASNSTQVPCAVVGCSVSSPTPNVVDPSMKFSITVNATTSVGTMPGSARLQLTVTPPAGGTYSYNSPQQPLNGNAVVFGGLGPTTKVGVYGVTGTLTGVGSAQTCTGSVSVVYMPYLNVYGGDVMTGSSPSYTGGTIACGTDPSAGVFGWNDDNRNGLGYAGAGAQYAVQALGDLTSSSTAGQIEDFASGLSPTNTPPTPPVNLSFANTDPSRSQPTNGLFGGAFGAASNDCDFTSDITPTANADTILPATTVSPGTSKVVYVTNHDVYISGDIVYGYDPSTPGGWVSVSRIPSFRLVVTGGDIYISNNVSKLNGLYVAEPVGGSGGRIFTCAIGLRADIKPAVAGSYTICNKQLEITGAFVAKYVAFGRTYGSLGQAKITDSLTSNHDAEVFNYTPELWLPRNTSAPDGSYASITGLPPIL